MSNIKEPRIPYPIYKSARKGLEVLKQQIELLNLRIRAGKDDPKNAARNVQLLRVLESQLQDHSPRVQHNNPKFKQSKAQRIAEWRHKKRQAWKELDADAKRRTAAIIKQLKPPWDD